MKAFKNTVFVTAIFFVATTLLASGNLVFCFGTSHTALEYLHSPEFSQSDRVSSFALPNNSEACVDVPVSKEAKLSLDFKVIFLKEAPFQTIFSRAIQSDSKSLVADRDSVSRALHEFISSVRLII